MRIPVPEMNERFACTEDAIEHMIRICSVIVDKAKVVCPSNSVSDIPGYVLDFCRKVLIQATTLVKVASSSSFGAAAFAAARPAWGAEGSLGQRPNVPGAGKIPMKT